MADLENFCGMTDEQRAEIRRRKAMDESNRLKAIQSTERKPQPKNSTLCLDCDGTGIVETYPPHGADAYDGAGGVKTEMGMCNNCMGLGWIPGVELRRTRWAVYVTPADGVGGEFPKPARIASRRVCDDYARACRERLGQKTRIARYSEDR